MREMLELETIYKILLRLYSLLRQLGHCVRSHGKFRPAS